MLTQLLTPYLVCVRQFLLFALPLLSTLNTTNLQADDFYSWSELPALPDPAGFAGSFAGTHNSTLIVAGGANFPDKMPWDGGAKVWYDGVFVLGAPEDAWKDAGKLPRPLGYGVSISTNDGVVCIGGSDTSQHYSDCFRMGWRENKLTTVELPPIPSPCANACGALIDGIIYVAGGLASPTAHMTLKTFWSLDLADPNAKWQELEPWPGPARMLATAAVQDDAFFLCSGVDFKVGADGNPTREYLRDAYRYQPGRGWKRIADLPRAAVACPTPAPAFGQSSFLIIGGDDGTLENFQPPEKHPGFQKSILAYHTITNTWKVSGRARAGHVTTGMTPWFDRHVISSGEIRPGKRSPAVWALAITNKKTAFGWINYSVLMVYLLVMVIIGLVCSGKNEGTNDFFRGGQRIPWWAAGLSVFATMLSSITFMAIPAAAYMNDWSLFLANSYILITPLVVFVYLPFYRRLNVTSAYEYLELRFNLATRLIGSCLFILYQFGRISVVLYLPALALATVSDFNIQNCIVLMGLLCILYTVAGGIAAVIWTDVVQAFILIGGALISLAYLLTRVNGGMSETLRTASADNKFFEAVDWSWDLTVASGWVILIGSLFHNLFPYTASQDVVQRYLTTPDRQTAARGIWLSAMISVPAQAAFFAIGTALFVFYKQQPERLDVTLRNDAIFPFFVMSELPAGLAGLIVAGIFAAAQSTLSSSMNSIATAYVTDIHHRLRPNLSDQSCLRAARIVTVFVGATGTVFALVLASTDIRSIYMVVLEIMGLLGGSLAGLFLLGIFSRRVSGNGALAGVIVSAIFVFVVRAVQPLHAYAYAPLGVITCFVVGWLVSFLLPASTKNVIGLTIYSS